MRARPTVLFAIGIGVVPAVLGATPVFSTTCGDKPYVYDSLAGFGAVASDFRDKYGDTVSIGSALAIADWTQHENGSFDGLLYGLPDRGWNTNGTINYVPRLHKFRISFTPAEPSGGGRPLPRNLALVYLDTILLKGPDGQPTTGLDADQSGGLNYPGFPTLPAATYPGDGFGGDGPGGKRISLDAESLVLGSSQGSFWIGDEYGPNIYKFRADGTMIAAIAPPEAIVPLRQGLVSFASDNPPRYDPNKHPVPSNPTQGRQNNQGFEGLTASPDGKQVFAMLQSALQQEGGASSSTRQLTRLLQYRLPSAGSGDSKPSLEAEYIVPLPTYVNSKGKTRIAAQSEIHFVSPTQLLVLPRDSGAGRGASETLSRYRHVDVIDISSANNIRGIADAFNTSIASTDGVLNQGVVPATLCPFVDFNNNGQLARFGLHNGGAQDAGLLNEKWEGLALVPANEADKDEWFLFAASDNDFITQNGYINFGKLPYQDASGFNVDSQILVFKIKLPPGSKPRMG